MQVTRTAAVSQPTNPKHDIGFSLNQPQGSPKGLHPTADSLL
jgi:hypothetical protein